MVVWRPSSDQSTPPPRTWSSVRVVCGLAVLAIHGWGTRGTVLRLAGCCEQRRSLRASPSCAGTCRRSSTCSCSRRRSAPSASSGRSRTAVWSPGCFFFTAVGAQSVQWECRYAFRGWTDDAGNAAWPQPKQRAKAIPISGGFESRRNSEHAVNARQYGTYSVHT